MMFLLLIKKNITLRAVVEMLQHYLICIRLGCFPC